MNMPAIRTLLHAFLARCNVSSLAVIYLYVDGGCAVKCSFIVIPLVS